MKRNRGLEDETGDDEGGEQQQVISRFAGSSLRDPMLLYYGLPVLLSKFVEDCPPAFSYGPAVCKLINMGLLERKRTTDGQTTCLSVTGEIDTEPSAIRDILNAINEVGKGLTNYMSTEKIIFSKYTYLQLVRRFVENVLDNGKSVVTVRWVFSYNVNSPVKFLNSCRILTHKIVDVAVIDKDQISDYFEIAKNLWNYMTDKVNYSITHHITHHTHDQKMELKKQWDRYGVVYPGDARDKEILKEWKKLHATCMEYFTLFGLKM